MSRYRRRRSRVRPIYSFAITWFLLSTLLPMYQVWGLLLTLGICSTVAYLVGRASATKDAAEDQAQNQTQNKTQTAAPKPGRAAEATAAKSASSAPKKSYGPEVDPIVQEGNRALSEMGRLYLSIKDPEVRVKINEIMRITDKIVQDAIQDPSDIPQIKKFMNYYLPTTIKLLNAYDRMSAQGIEGENLDKSMKNINEMLDAAIVAYKKRLDSLFANQALDIETDIDVMNTMLAREGLTENQDFKLSQSGR